MGDKVVFGASSAQECFASSLPLDIDDLQSQYTNTTKLEFSVEDLCSEFQEINARVQQMGMHIDEVKQRLSLYDDGESTDYHSLVGFVDAATYEDTSGKAPNERM